jgi:seryl-tRNA synthetase
MQQDRVSFQDGGKLVVAGPYVEVLQRLDECFRGWARDLGATEYVFPPLLSLSKMIKCDYLTSFPHLATFATSLLPSELGNSAAGVEAGMLAPPQELLTPAACYPAYAHLEGSRLDAPCCLTMRGWCFRREAEYAQLERQSCFNMREVVYLGDALCVQEFLTGMRARLQAFFAELALPVSFETATDPFFGDSANPKYMAQLLDPVKLEMVFKGRLAIGSLNFHRNYFGEKFGISYAGGAAFSGCVAFGLERWLGVLIETYGPDPRNFPAPFRPGQDG